MTGLFDLAKREGNLQRRAPDFYLQHGEFLFGLDQDIIFFVEQECKDRVLARRRAHRLLDRTHLIVTSLEAMPAYTFAQAICEARQQQPILNANPNKDTVLYTVLQWSKFTLLEQALAADPFRSTHFAWIDLGIAHVARTRYCIEDGVFAQPADKVKLMMMKSFTPEDLFDQQSYLSHLRGYSAAGYISASRASLHQLGEIFWAEAQALLEQGYAPSEEQLLPILSVQRPDLFEFYYGDYDFILENYSQIRGAAENLLFQMRHCRNRQDFRRGCDIGARLLTSSRAGTFEATPDYLSALLDEYFIAAYYLEYPEQGTAREVASYYAQLVRSHPAFREVFQGNQDHIRRNFSFLKEKILL